MLFVEERSVIPWSYCEREGDSHISSKVKTVSDWPTGPTPNNLKEVRSFVGPCSYYRKFIRGLSEIASPLHALTKKSVKFVWSAECRYAFDALKTKLTESPILSLPLDDGLLYVLDTDASGESIGAVLSQVQEKEERVIRYASRMCSSADRNYNVIRRELLAIIYFLKYNRFD